MVIRIWLAVIAIVLTFLHAMPWLPGRHEPILFGVVPITIALWVLWTVAVMLVVAWISFRYDPYAPVVRDVENRITHKGAGGQDPANHRKED